MKCLNNVYFIIDGLSLMKYQCYIKTKTCFNLVVIMIITYSIQRNLDGVCFIYILRSVHYCSTGSLGLKDILAIMSGESFQLSCLAECIKHGADKSVR